MVDTRIKDLPLNGSPNANQFVPTDLSATEKMTIQTLVDTGAPVASQAEAEAGTNNVKRMTALTTKQSIDQFAMKKSANLSDVADVATSRTNLGLGTAAVEDATAFATAAQGATADTALQPADIGVDVQAFDTDLTAIAALTSAADKMPYATGAGTWALADLTAAGRAILDDADADAQRTTLGVAIGTDVQAYDADLAAIAALTSAADKVPYSTGAGTWALANLTAVGRELIDDTFADGDLGLSQTRRFIDGVLSGAVYDSSVAVLDGDAPNFFVVRYAQHTVAASGVPRAFGVLTQILADVKNYEFAGESSLEDKTAQTEEVDFVGFKSSYIRFATADGTLASGWAGYDEMHDQTGLASSLSGGALRGREITMIASAADDASIRYGLDVVHSKLPSYAGTDTEFAVGVRVVNAGFYGLSFGKTVVGTAFDANGEDPFSTGSSIQTGFRGYVSSVGVLIDGNPADGSFVAEVFGSTSVMKLGMKEVNSSAGQIQFTSRNNAGTQKTAFSMDGGLSDPTTSTEDGRMSMVAMIAGTGTEVFAIFPEGDASNPVYVRVDGAMRKVIVDGSNFLKVA